MRKELISKSKFLSLTLRHCPDQIGIVLDPNGWTSVNDLLQKSRLSKSELDEIVSTNDKKRFEYSSDGQSIRACQGHSVDANLALSPTNPPDFLYHGTSDNSVNAIMQSGIMKMQRTHVHLSETVDTATKVGSRHGKPVVITVFSKQMIDDGILFYRSTNGVWLTDFVDKKYLSLQTSATPVVKSIPASTSVNNLF